MFAKSIKNAFKNTFNYQGCSTRSEYWYFILFSVIISIITNIIDYKCVMHGFFPAVGLTWILIYSIVVLSLTTRRLHDINKSGWTQLFFLIPIAGSLIVLYFLVQPTQKSKYCDNIIKENTLNK